MLLPSRYAVVLPLLLVSPATSASVSSPALKRVPRHDHLRADTGHGVTPTSRPGQIPTAEPADEDQDETQRPALSALSWTLPRGPWNRDGQRAVPRARPRASLPGIRSRAPPR